MKRAKRQDEEKSVKEKGKRRRRKQQEGKRWRQVEMNQATREMRERSTWAGHDDERSPPGLNDAWSERQGGSQGGQSGKGLREGGEEGRQE